MSLRAPSQKIVVAIIYICGMLMNSLDSTIVTVALATLSREFGVSPAATEGVVIGYLVSLAVFIPTSGWLGDRWGTKRTFLLALALFTAASALCGLAGSLNQLILFRILQGAGGGLLTPVGMAMLYRTYPPQERVGVARILMFATILGPACGPILGGFLIEQLSWRWAFYVNMPVGLAALLFGAFFLHEHREEGARAVRHPRLPPRRDRVRPGDVRAQRRAGPRLGLGLDHRARPDRRGRPRHLRHG